MRNLLIFSFLILVSGGCALNGVSGNGNVLTKDRELENFDGISISGSLNLEILQAADYQVVVQADENLQDIIETYVEDRTLIIRSVENIRQAKRKDIQVKLPQLRMLDMSGATEVKTRGPIEGGGLSLVGSGASELDGELNYQKMKAELSGATELNLRGTINKVAIRSSGATELSWSNLKIGALQLESSGATEAELYVTERMSIEASGASDIEYRGNPVIEKQQLSGAASLKNI